MSDYPASNGMVPDLRRALQHLYERVELRENPLIEILGLDQQADKPSALRHLLLEAIEALKPSNTVSLGSNAWRTYNVLCQRYVEQLSPQEVALDLGLGIRQLQRSERGALQTLADYLCTHHELKSIEITGQANGSAPTADAGVSSPEQELQWLRQSVECEQIDIGELIGELLELISHLARSQTVRVDSFVPRDLPPASVHRVTLRQAMLIVLSAAIQSAPGGSVRIEVQVRDESAHVDIRSENGQAVAPDTSPGTRHDLQMARRLVELSGGSLWTAPEESLTEPLTAKLTLPLVRQMPVLVIDDNVDALRLFERYLANSHYRMSSVNDPQQILAVVEQVLPQIIVLDVMLPGIDGWELLGRLRVHPRTRDVPIVVCTILPQEQLALSLGADAFLNKPIKRDDFLAALDHQLA